MAIRHLLWACVECGREGTLQQHKRMEVCSACRAAYARARGDKIEVVRSTGERKLYSPRELIALLPEISRTGSARCHISESICDRPVHQFGRYLGRYECLGEPRAGELVLAQDRLSFTRHDGDGFEVPLLDITAIQPSSSTLQIKARKRPVFAIRFESSSPKLWEERLQLAVNDAYGRAGLGEVVEYQPRVTTRERQVKGTSVSRVRRRIRGASSLSPKRPWQYRLASWIARNAWKRFGGGLRVEGLEHVPSKGPFLVLANHESYLETMLVPAVMRRAIHMMAKSTQFGSRLTGWLMARLNAYPVRRFEIDPQAVRYTVDRLSEGYGIAIFIEGERTWDGTLQAGRFGTVRLALAAGVPVIPCHVEGAYEAWPRWWSKPQRNPIVISFGQPIALPAAATRAEREAALGAALGAICARLGGLDFA